MWALDVAHMTLAYKRRSRANTATWSDSDSDGYRKRDDSDSDGDSDDRGQPSKGNTSKPMSQMRQERASEHSLFASRTTYSRSLGAAHSAECTRLPVCIFKSSMPVSITRSPVCTFKSTMPVSCTRLPVCILKSTMRVSILQGCQCAPLSRVCH